MLAAYLPSTWWSTRAEEEEEWESEEESEDEEESNRLAEQLTLERRILREKNIKLKSKLKEIERMVQQRPPVWLPDSARYSCASCQARFSLLNRRHHCRACGDIFDASCSSKVVELPFLSGSGPQRVCNGCFVTLTQPAEEDKGDMEYSALIALGFGDLLAIDDSIVMLPEMPIQSVKRVSKKKKKTRTIRENATANQSDGIERNANGRPRSAIPLPPPFPTNLPKSIAPAAPFIRLQKDPLKKPFVPPATNLKRLDMQELKEGIARLRKTPHTPAKQEVKKDEAVTDLRSSLRRRRKVMEDSILSGQQTEAEQENISCNIEASIKTGIVRDDCLIRGLRETLIFKESPIPVQNPSNNSSWLE